MPLRDFRCEACDARFEELVKGDDFSWVRCPACDSGDIVKLLSKFVGRTSDSSGGTKTLSGSGGGCSGCSGGSCGTCGCH